jgi:hypothetical protein
VIVPLRLIAVSTVSPNLKCMGGVVSTAYYRASSLLEVAEVRNGRAKYRVALMRVTSQSNLAHRSTLSAARFITADRSSLLSELRTRGATTPVLGICLCNFLSLLFFHLFILLTKLCQIKLHDILN